MNRDGTPIDPYVSVLISEFLEHKLGQHGYQWTSPLPRTGDGSNAPNPRVGAALLSLSDDFASHYKDALVEMCGNLNINKENLKQALDGVANELFSDDIKYGRVVALFAFVSELAIHFKNRNWFDLIDLIAISLAIYVSEKLLPWINDHGGWNEVIVNHA